MMRRSPSSRFLSWFFRVFNRFIAWHRLPGLSGAVNLLSFREDLREQNLHSTSEEVIPAKAGTLPVPDPDAGHRAEYIHRRASDGMFNDPNHPRMGCTFARFGRNFPLDQVYPELMPGLLEPSPRIISNRLLARTEFQPATTLNLLAAAWIQFMTHDWFNHGHPIRDKAFRIPLDPDDDWKDQQGQKLGEMKIRCTPHDPTRVHGDKGYPSTWVDDPGAERRPPDGPPTYLNHGSHWWDGSQIYGSSEKETAELRCGEHEDERDSRGELKMSETRELLTDPQSHLVQTGFSDNWWLGLSILHTAFVREHNAIAATLRLDYPHWSGDRIFQTARLVNTALLANIHTVEWTPGILAHPALEIGMSANWWGLAGERITRLMGRLSDSETISGIMGSPPDHHSAPYALTDDFVAVYRLHPLLPDTVRMHRVHDGAFVREIPFEHIIGPATSNALKCDPSQGPELSLADACYSFGISHPGAITLHNYPHFLRNLKRFEADGVTLDQVIDLASIDIMRDRERGVPRYNRFRTLLRRPPVTSFDEITSNKAWAAELKQIYGDVDRVDLLVGMLAEDLPKGFGFSDTAFRIFILMASRRLKSDRFFTTDYTPAVYTRRGLDWINENTMSSVLIRHFPEVTPALRLVKNAFAPWDPIEGVLQVGSADDTAADGAATTA